MRTLHRGTVCIDRKVGRLRYFRGRVLLAAVNYLEADRDSAGTGTFSAPCSPRRRCRTHNQGSPVSAQKEILPKRPIQYGLLRQPAEDFESLVARLVRLECPTAIKLARTSDGGADMVLPADGDEGYDRCWQTKHFPAGISWAKCKDSLRAAREHWNPAHYTFVFPRELTKTEQKTFKNHFGGLDITVDYWNGDRLQGLLTGSEEGQRVARTFFDDVELDKENLQRSIEVGGRLDSPDDALDRLSNVGGFLASGDAYFSYPAVTHESDGPSPPAPSGAVMSFSSSEGQITSRIDIVPRDSEAMERYAPEFVLAASDDETGRKAREQLEAALREGKAVEIGEGLEVTPTRMPPAFQGIVGEPLTGTVQIGPAERARPQAKRWKATLTAEDMAREASVSVVLAQTPKVPDGWDDCFEGNVGGMTVTALFREFSTGGGEVRWNFHHRRDNSPVRHQLRALRFLDALGSGGEITVDGEGGRLSKSSVGADPLPSDALALIAFFEDVRTIEEWAEVQFDLPATVEAEQARSIAYLARMMRGIRLPVTWEPFDITVRDAQNLSEQGVLRIEGQSGARILGQEVKLGFVRVEMTEYEVIERAKTSDGPGMVSARVQPIGDGPGQGFESLSKAKTLTGRPPPPPPRKRGAKKHGNKKRGRRRGR